jgi:hypothetical protein
MEFVEQLKDLIRVQTFHELNQEGLENIFKVNERNAIIPLASDRLRTLNELSDFIQSKFKGEITILCEPEEQRDENAPLRVYDVPKYGVRYMLQMNKVVRMTAFTNEFWTENKTKWVACK